VSDEQTARAIRDMQNRLDQLESLSKLNYNKGTWTPALVGTTIAGTFTYDATSTSGEWTRIGNRIHLNGRVRITAITVAPTGTLTITGLPFTSAAPVFNIPGGAVFTGWQGITLPAGYTQIALRLLASATIFTITRTGSNVAQVGCQGGEFVLVGGLANFDFFGEYRI
jgi:hypothetical protein